MRIIHSEIIGHYESKGKRLAIYSLDFQPNSFRLATAGGDCCVKIWNSELFLQNATPNTSVSVDNIKSNSLLCTLTSHTKAVNIVRWSPDGKYLATGGDDNYISLHILAPSSHPSTNSSFGLSNKSIQKNQENWIRSHTLQGHTMDILDLDWNKENGILASASIDNRILLWDIYGATTGGYSTTEHSKIISPFQILTGHKSFVKGLSFDPIGKYLISSDSNNIVIIWDCQENYTMLRQLTEPLKGSPETTIFRRIDWAPDGTSLCLTSAMKSSKPIGMILSRNEWDDIADLVGHHTHSVATKFCPYLFHATNATDSTSSSGESTTSIASMVALGDLEGYLSIWGTHRERPMFVLRDIFADSITDIAWLRSLDITTGDGVGGRKSTQKMVLACCSLTGEVIFFDFDAELGKLLSGNEVSKHLEGLYGKSSQEIASARNIKGNIMNNGNKGTREVLVQNPIALQYQKKGSSGNKMRLAPTTVIPADKTVGTEVSKNSDVSLCNGEATTMEIDSVIPTDNDPVPSTESAKEKATLFDSKEGDGSSTSIGFGDSSSNAIISLPVTGGKGDTLIRPSAAILALLNKTNHDMTTNSSSAPTSTNSVNDRVIKPKTVQPQEQTVYIDKNGKKRIRPIVFNTNYDGNEEGQSSDRVDCVQDSSQSKRFRHDSNYSNNFNSLGNGETVYQCNNSLSIIYQKDEMVKFTSQIPFDLISTSSSSSANTGTSNGSSGNNVKMRTLPVKTYQILVTSQSNYKPTAVSTSSKQILVEIVEKPSHIESQLSSSKQHHGSSSSQETQAARRLLHFIKLSLIDKKATAVGGTTGGGAPSGLLWSTLLSTPSISNGSVSNTTSIKSNSHSSSSSIGQSNGLPVSPPSVQHAIEILLSSPSTGSTSSNSLLSSANRKYTLDRSSNDHSTVAGVNRSVGMVCLGHMDGSLQLLDLNTGIALCAPLIIGGGPILFIDTVVDFGESDDDHLGSGSVPGGCKLRLLVMSSDGNIHLFDSYPISHSTKTLRFKKSKTLSIQPVLLSLKSTNHSPPTSGVTQFLVEKCHFHSKSHFPLLSLKMKSTMMANGNGYQEQFIFQYDLELGCWQRLFDSKYFLSSLFNEPSDNLQSQLLLNTASTNPSPEGQTKSHSFSQLSSYVSQQFPLTTKETFTLAKLRMITANQQNKPTSSGGGNSQEIANLEEYMDLLTYQHAEERLNVVLAIGDEHEIIRCVLDWMKVLLQAKSFQKIEKFIHYLIQCIQSQTQSIPSHHDGNKPRQLTNLFDWIDHLATAHLDTTTTTAVGGGGRVGGSSTASSGGGAGDGARSTNRSSKLLVLLFDYLLPTIASISSEECQQFLIDINQLLVSLQIHHSTVE